MYLFFSTDCQHVRSTGYHLAALVRKFPSSKQQHFSDIETSWHMVRIGGANTTQTNHQLNNLDDNTLYDFIVVAISPGGGPSEESPVVSASTLPLSKSLENGRVVFSAVLFEYQS